MASRHRKSYLMVSSSLNTSSLQRQFRPRKWKDKLKEWGFEKHLAVPEMKVIIAKAEKRARAGKDTVFIHNGIVMPTEKIENFKRRKVVRETAPASPSAR
jgi:hypothetical protein